MTFRRLGSLLLTVALALGSISLCPKGNCPMVQKAAHDCCDKGPGLAAPSCCPDAAGRSAPWLAPAGASELHGLVVRLVTAPIALPRPLAPSAAAFATVASSHGPAPPGTLTAQHTSLLL